MQAETLNGKLNAIDSLRRVYIELVDIPAAKAVEDHTELIQVTRDKLTEYIESL
jgi:hypothetical protein